jgi:hypothetical protein
MVMARKKEKKEKDGLYPVRYTRLSDFTIIIFIRHAWTYPVFCVNRFSISPYFLKNQISSSFLIGLVINFV